jgi:protein-L-isoaspartate(D-aspartate) O-methyltransferase
MGDAGLASMLLRKGIADERVLLAIASLERRMFVSAEEAAEACGDYPLPIGFDQTISQPFIVAYMTQALALTGNERVLEVGTGSGYQAAVLARLAREVLTLEIIPELARQAAARLKALGLTNVHVREGDGAAGWPEEAPFDAILVTAAPPFTPPELLAQLGRGGRMVAPVGTIESGQELVRYQRLDDGSIRSETLLSVRFVPMTGPGVPEHAAHLS